MKKYIAIPLVIICVLLLVSCTSNKSIRIPGSKDIVAIEMEKNSTKMRKEMTKQEAIYQMINKIKKNTIDTGNESVSEQPVNIEDYIIIKFHHKNAEESPSIIYLYNVKGKSYIEQPYSGIWELKKEILF